MSWKKKVNRKEARKVVWLGLPIWLYKEPISVRERGACSAWRFFQTFILRLVISVWVLAIANAIHLCLFLSLCYRVHTLRYSWLVREIYVLRDYTIAQFLQHVQTCSIRSLSSLLYKFRPNSTVALCHRLKSFSSPLDFGIKESQNISFD